MRNRHPQYGPAARLLVACGVAAGATLPGCDGPSSLPMAPSWVERPARTVAPPAPSAPPRDTSLEGRYAITFSAAETCVELPSALRTRTYEGVLERSLSDARLFKIALGGADFFPDYDTLWGTANTDSLVFYFFSWHAMNRWLEDLPIVERLEAGRALSLSGTAPIDAIEPTRRELSSAISGVVSYCPAPGRGEAPYYQCPEASISCTSAHHRLTLVRQDDR